MRYSPIHGSGDFHQLPIVHPANHRFFTPLFSVASESLFSQVLSFQKYLHSPLVFSRSGCWISGGTNSRVTTHVFSCVCRLLFSLGSLFHIPFLCFQELAASFVKMPGWGAYPSPQSSDFFARVTRPLYPRRRLTVRFP